MATKQFWIIFLKDPTLDVVFCRGYGHNTAGDYKNNPSYIGYKVIDVDLDNLDNMRKP